MQITPEDLELWRNEKRDDILACVKIIEIDGHIISSDAWFNPKDKIQELQRCPWLRKVRNRRKYICRIEDVKPKVCRDYPVNMKQVARDKCPGIKR